MTDFDLAALLSDEYLNSRGTKDYRAPELYSDEDSDIELTSLDIFSLGVILFTMMSGGYLPFLEPEKKSSNNNSSNKKNLLTV